MERDNLLSKFLKIETLPICKSFGCYVLVPVATPRSSVTNEIFTLCMALDENSKLKDAQPDSRHSTGQDMNLDRVPYVGPQWYRIYLWNADPVGVSTALCLEM